MFRNFRWPLAAVVLAVIVSALPSADGNDSPRVRRGRRARPLHAQTHVRDKEEQADADAESSGDEEEVFATGFLFIDGQYVPPPYVLRFTESGFVINGRRLVDHDAPTDPDDSRPRSFDASESELSQLATGIVVSFGGRATFLPRTRSPGQDLLRWLAGDVDREAVEAALLDWRPEDQDAQWRQWLRTFEPSRRLAERAARDLEHLEATAISNERASSAMLRLHAASYPLTVMGMSLCVFAIGHLLRYRPEEVQASSRGVLLTLGLVFALSALDLVWTLLAHQAGQMRELNPLGSRLIENVWLLSAFKLGLTALAVGVLYRLREHAFARAAGWWACLVLTLLLIRWVAVNSLFMA